MFKMVNLGIFLSPGAANSHPLQYSCLENSLDRGAWRAIYHGVAKSHTRLKCLTHTQCVCLQDCSRSCGAHRQKSSTQGEDRDWRSFEEMKNFLTENGFYFRAWRQNPSPEKLPPTRSSHPQKWRPYFSFQRCYHQAIQIRALIRNIQHVMRWLQDSKGLEIPVRPEGPTSKLPSPGLC